MYTRNIPMYECVMCVCVSENCLSIFQLHRSKAVAPKAKAKAGLRMEFPLS